MARLFDGDDDRIVCDLGNANSALTGAFTLSFLLRPDSSHLGGWVNTTGGNDWAVWQDGTTVWVFTASGPERSFTGHLTAGDWHEIHLSKPSGTSTPRLHSRNLRTNVWTHTDGSGTVANESIGSERDWIIGREDFGGNTFDGAIGAIAMFGSAIASDNAAESRTGWAAWMAAAPAIAWDFRTIPLVDEGSGASADQISITGTTATDPPSGFFSSVVEAAAALSGAGTLTASAHAIRSAATALGGTASLATTSRRVRRAAATLTATGSLSASAQVEAGGQTIEAAAALAGSATLTAAAGVLRTASATLAGVATLTVRLYQPVQLRQARPPADLTVEIQGPGGETYRLAPNAIDPRNRPMGLSFSTEQGEGFHTGSIPLSRDFLADHPDVRLLHSVTLVGADGRIAYEGRVSGTPRERGDRDILTVDTEGWMSHARQRRHTELIVDRDLGQWGQPARARRLAVLGFGHRWQDNGTLDQDEEGAYLRTELQNSWPGHTRCELYYRSLVPIGLVSYEFEKGPNINTADSWQWNVLTAAADDGLSATSTANLEATSGSGTLTVPGYRHAWLSLIYPSAGGTSGANYNVDWRVAVVGAHGLTELERADGGPDGYAAADIIRYLYGRYAPKLSLAGVQQTSYPIPHAVWRDPTTAHEAALEVNKYHLWQLAVWENRTLHYSPPDLTIADWQVRAGQDGCTVSTPGDTTESAYNGCAVTYTDFGGATWRVTPEDSAELRDDSEWIAANQWGEQSWMEVTVSWQCLQDDAITIGAALLAQQNRAKRPATITVGMHIRDRYGDWQPSWMPRVGQTVSITNHPSEEPRLITGTQWQDHQLTITTDDAIPSVEAMIDRTNMQLAAAGVGG